MTIDTLPDFSRQLPTMDHDTAVQLDGVAKSFGAVRAVEDLSLHIGRGETVALLGPNGAGKTTTISMLLGLVRPDHGLIRVLGGSPDRAAGAGLIGAMLQDGGLMRGVLVGELLAMLASQYRAPASLDEVCELAQIGDITNRRTDRLSGGQAQRARVAIALVGNPDLLVLDEPTAAMDVESRRSFWSRIAEQAARGRTVLFSTHYLEEADEHAERVVVLAGGRLVADGSPASIKASVGLRAVRFRAARADLAFEQLPGVTSMAATTRGIELRSTDTDATLRALLSAHPGVHDIEVGDVGLEEAFLALTADRAA